MWHLLGRTGWLQPTESPPPCTWHLTLPPLLCWRRVAEEVLPRLAAQVGAGAVYCYGEVTREEQRVEGAVAAALDRQGARLVTSWGGTLYHRDDLPFQLKDLPPSYGEPAHDP